MGDGVSRRKLLVLGPPRVFAIELADAGISGAADPGAENARSPIAFGFGPEVLRAWRGTL
jgi:hypothetical protein